MGQRNDPARHPDPVPLTYPIRLKLADHTTALLPLPVRHRHRAPHPRPVVLAALRDYFDLLWERSTPPTTPHPQSPHADRLPPAQQRILELVAEGLPDPAIARRAEISISTVRRHVTAIMHRLGAESRFTAGAAAHRRGWIS
jgi:DNA-binding CsgD family transcriptional regulator